MTEKTKELYLKQLVFLENTLKRLQYDIKNSGVTHYHGWGATQREEPNPSIEMYNKLLPTYCKLLKDLNEYDKQNNNNINHS